MGIPLKSQAGTGLRGLCRVSHPGLGCWHGRGASANPLLCLPGPFCKGESRGKGESRTGTSALSGHNGCPKPNPWINQIFQLALKTAPDESQTLPGDLVTSVSCPLCVPSPVCPLPCVPCPLCVPSPVSCHLCALSPLCLVPSVSLHLCVLSPLCPESQGQVLAGLWILGILEWGALGSTDKVNQEPVGFGGVGKRCHLLSADGHRWPQPLGHPLTSRTCLQPCSELG